MNIHQLKQPEPSFEEFWKWYPHAHGRRSKADARSLYKAITGPAGAVVRCRPRGSDQFESVHRVATEQEILDGVKEYRKTLPKKSADSFERDTRYVEDACVWLRNGRWEY